MTSRLPRVSGHCPACGTASLFLGDGGYVTCSWIDCPNPDAAATILDDGREVEHIVTLTARTFSVSYSGTRVPMDSDRTAEVEG